jgi:Fe-S-cluster-containing hydrogenase component 2
MTERNHKYLVIDLQKCDECRSCNITCSISCDYHDKPGEENPGLSGLRERATFALVCRRCNSASCIKACVFDALERRPDGVIQRHNLRCVSCKMCAHACPFGTIYTDMLSFYQANCDLCLDQIDTQPPCVASCPNGALEFRMMDPAETDVHIVDQRLAARTLRWIRQEVSA